MRNVGKFRFFTMALFDTLHTMAMSLPLGVLPGPLAISVPQVLSQWGEGGYVFSLIW